jgi:hypothetical protein
MPSHAPLVVEDDVNVEINGITICGGNAMAGSVVLNYGTMILENVTLLYLPGSIEPILNMGEMIVRDNVVIQDP